MELGPLGAQVEDSAQYAQRQLQASPLKPQGGRSVGLCLQRGQPDPQDHGWGTHCRRDFFIPIVQREGGEVSLEWQYLPPRDPSASGQGALTVPSRPVA